MTNEEFTDHLLAALQLIVLAAALGLSLGVIEALVQIVRAL